jgi:hypothetical protein
MRWAWHAECIEEMRTEHNISVAKSERKRATGGDKCRWEDNIKLDLKNRE